MARANCYGDVVLHQVQSAIETAIVPSELSSVIWLDFVNECLSNEMRACHLKTSTVHVWQNYARQWRANLPKLKVSRFLPLYTGSYFEGMPNSIDVDMLLIDKWFLLCEKWRLYLPSGLIMSNVDCYPGYIRIIVTPDIQARTYFHSYQLKKVGDEHYLSSTGYIQAMRESGTPGHDYPAHGPALSYGTTNDIVYALKCEDWPSFAQDALIRRRKQPIRLPIGPDSPMVYVVAVGHHRSANSDIEWRLSFSDAEKTLVMGWTECQRSCYFLLKQFRVTFLNDPADVLCSYYMKTLVFWLSDILPQTFWCAENFHKGFVIALCLLKTFLKEKNIPHYFIPENNMISHKDDDECASLLIKLENSLTSGQLHHKIVEMICQISIESLYALAGLEYENSARSSCRQLFTLVRHFMDYEHGMLIYEAELLSSLTIMMSMEDRHQCDAMESTLAILSQLVSKDMVPALQILLQRKIASYYQSLGSRTSLKRAEDLYKQSLKLLYPSGYNDKQVSGKIELAFFHYLNKQYETAERLISELISVFRSMLETSTVDYYLCIALSSWESKRFQNDQYLFNVVQKLPREVPLIVNIVILAVYILIECYLRQPLTVSQRMIELKHFYEMFHCFGRLSKSCISRGSFHTLLQGILAQRDLGVHGSDCLRLG